MNLKGTPKILAIPWPFLKSRFHCTLLFSITFVLKYNYEFLICILKKMTLWGKLLSRSLKYYPSLSPTPQGAAARFGAGRRNA